VSDSVHLQLTDGMRAWLQRATRHWSQPAEPPHSLPQGVVRPIASGGPFGHRFDARLDVVDGRLALEVLENSRMAGEQYFRVWDDGTLEPLEPAPQIGYSYREASEKAAAEAAYFAHNRRAYAHLRERGFMGSSSTT
jgi:hypothetical protein